ncbi:EcoAI/FtnUII family type I restriction enzme subunit R [Methanosarcina sp. 1.H.A.2.2]|uniref:EcoAI/FtnUII family type I restriction enzme subunit R n=1 Tax=Methanosarcina sp. 1.H.A.2.2 TaxID=1483601 RepID=UPI0006212974|nr:type I restriction endonuclease subunit R [Methanosarcina sp. 1.H.A.2.2]KKH46616.1 restriction endonuclease subunit R [Methanosarcina sp. 1.H.A.2.2]
MNEAETRAELIDPKLVESGWGVVEGSKILREYHLTLGRIQTGGKRAKPLIADYVLVYKDRKLAVIEAKSDKLEVGEGVAQAKNYAEKMHVETTFAANGREIYQMCMKTGAEGLIPNFPTPEELWNKTFATQNHWRETFSQVPFENMGSTKAVRYYQEIAVNNTMAAIAEEKQRILLTLATGTGKTFIAFQIAWKLFQTRWNLKRDGKRRPRILFLADRNILADQAFNAFSAFPEDALVRISPKEISKKGSVPTNGSIFFTIFQTFMSGPENTPYFGAYPADYFDFIVIDECHRGGANDEGNWRSIMEYFYPAVQLGLTATPKRDDNVDTYKYFGKPVYIYSLKEGINDGFLTPFKVKQIESTFDEYVYAPEDQVIEGEVEAGKNYTEPDFNRIIEIKEHESDRVKLFLSEIDQKEKTIVFCATQSHAAVVRDLVNQYKKSSEPNYCVRVTANDGKLGEQYLREFQDNENTVPTILTTSQKLSTGVDARNIRNIILMRPINSMIEFKQIVGRGTRLFDGKEYFTIYDFVKAHLHFADPKWDGEPMETEPSKVKEPRATYGSSEQGKKEAKKILKIKLRDGKEREIQHTISTSFWSAAGKPISAQEFLQNLFGILPEFFKDENELRTIWSNPMTRNVFLEKLAEAGYGMDELTTLQKLIDAEKSDLFDVLEYVSFALQPITREMRVNRAQSRIFEGLNDQQKEFLDFVLSKYIETGVGELSQDKLPGLLELKYHTISDAKAVLGEIAETRELFVGFQEYLYAPVVA